MIEELKDCIERNQTKEILKKNGWKVRSDIVITQMKKSELLEYIRMLEHNWACALMRHENTIRYIEGTINAKSAEDIKFLGVTMFEEEAEHSWRSKDLWYKVNVDESTYKTGFKDGYNKANEWHYPSKGELPKCDEETRLIFYVNYYYEVDSETFTRKRTVLGFYKKSFLNDDVKLFVEKSKGYEDEHLPKDVIAWKEIILPKELENDQKD